MTLRAGTQLGPYRLERPIGRGGQAVVYRAYDSRFDGHVAVKILADNHSLDPELNVRFSDEARALRSIRSPAVATVFDVGVSAEGQPYIVMEYADRGSLAERLRERPGASTSDVARVVAALAEAMTAMHAAGFVHRDIKPSNLLLRATGSKRGPAGLLLDSDEELILGDFGLAKNLGEASGLTVGAGTSGYAAPEQSKPYGRVDHRTDIHAATAVVVEVLLGRPDDDETWTELIHRRLGTGAMSDALCAGLATEMDDRPASAAIWDRSLRLGRSEEGRRFRVGSRPFGGNRRTIAGIALVALAAVGAIGALGPWGPTLNGGAESEGSANAAGTVADNTVPASPPSGSTPSVLDDGGGTLVVGSNRADVGFAELEADVGSPDELRFRSEQPITPSSPGWASFRCHFSHMGVDDPVLGRTDPDAVGHNTFFGNVQAASTSTGSSIAVSGDSTCAGGTVNRSSFWLSTLHDPLTGLAVPVDEMRLSYTVARPDLPFRAELAQLPAGFAHIMGNRAAEGTGAATTIVWNCDDGAGLDAMVIPDCGDETRLFVTFRFPQCWDGAGNGIETSALVVSLPTGGCPPSHPVLVPSLRVRVYYDVSGIDDSSRLRTAADEADASDGGRAMSGGYVHGWQAEDFQLMIDSCLKPPADCGFNLLAPGRGLSMPRTLG